MIRITGNDFTYDQEKDLCQSTVWLYNNCRNDDVRDGIVIVGTDPKPSFSYLCGNFIEKVSFSGVWTNYYQGYTKLCQIIGNAPGTSHNGPLIGFFMGLGDQPKIIASHISNCSNNGIFIESQSGSIADLTGVHGNGNDYAAFDTISNNGTLFCSPSTSCAQIVIQDLTGRVRLGDFGNGAWTNWGRNNIIKGNSGGGSLIELRTGTGLNISSVDHNFWDNGTAGVACTAAGVISTNITASCANTNPPLSTMTAWSGSISCSGSLNTKDPNDNQALQIAQPLSYDTCTSLKQWMYVDIFNKDDARKVYDSLRLYIEKCAARDDESFLAFNSLGKAVFLYDPDDTLRAARYRDWLISVLYLNTTQPFYFCRVLLAISGTYGSDKDPETETLARMAVVDFIRRQPQCHGDNLDTAFKNDSIYAIAKGWDPTNLPPLDSLGLGFLLKSGVDSHAPFLSHLASFTANPNPFKEDVNLQFKLNRTSYISIEIFDLLGRVVWESKGRTFTEGTHELSIEAQSLPKGTLYARITTDFGEVRTVKLAKE